MDKVYENERYVITIGAFQQPLKTRSGEFLLGYIITNKATGVEEVYSSQLPEAMAACEHLDMAMEMEEWTWIRVRGEAQAINKDTEH